MKKELFFVEVGVLLMPNEDEYNYYCINGFDFGFAYYDENRLTFFSKEKAFAYANKYIKNGVKMTYAIITSGVYEITKKEKKEINECAYCELSLENPQIEDVIYLAHKDKDNELVVLKEIRK